MLVRENEVWGKEEKRENKIKKKKIGKENQIKCRCALWGLQGYGGLAGEE